MAPPQHANSSGSSSAGGSSSSSSAGAGAAPTEAAASSSTPSSSLDAAATASTAAAAASKPQLDGAAGRKGSASGAARGGSRGQVYVHMADLLADVLDSERRGAKMFKLLKHIRDVGLEKYLSEPTKHEPAPAPDAPGTHGSAPAAQRVAAVEGPPEDAGDALEDADELQQLRAFLASSQVAPVWNVRRYTSTLRQVGPRGHEQHMWTYGHHQPGAAWAGNGADRGGGDAVGGVFLGGGALM